MKKLLSLVLAGVLSVGLLAACASSGSSSVAVPSSGAASGSASQGSLTLKSGVLQVGVEIGYPPMEYFAEDGVTPTGFDIEFSKALGEKLGLEVEFVDTAWDGIFASLDTDKYDVVISSVSITEERQEKYNLTKPYVANRLVLVTGKDSGITSPEDLAGKSVAVQAETTADIYMTNLIDGGLEVEYYEYDKVINCFDDLKNKRTDAVLVDIVVAAYYLGEDAAQFETVWESPDAEPMGLCLKKGNDALTEAIETAIDEMYADGTMEEIATKYFGSDITEGVR
ncbi:MAG: substrate-binding periplasmic protein [Oscillospiraceae bacterium]